ncbi:MAG: O-antigen ligase family protein [Burkholderiaceae bacterium]
MTSPSPANRAAAELRARRAPAALVACCIASPLLDVVTNVASYLDRPIGAVAALKGVILLVLIACLRHSASKLVVAGFLGIHALRELVIGLQGADIEFTGDLTYFLRIMTLVCWLLTFHERRADTAFMRTTLRVFETVAMTSALAGVLGFVLHLDFFKAYADERNGYKGLFFAENDTSIFYLVALVWGIARPRTAGGWYLPSVIAGIAMLGLGSKTALAGLLLVPALFLLFRERSRGRSAAILRGLLLYVLAPVAATWIGIEFESLIDAIGYDQLVRVLNESGLFSALLSYRDLKVGALLASIGSPIDLLFGLNIRHPYGIFGPETSGQHMIEIDLFDYLFRVGALGIGLTAWTLLHTTAFSRWRRSGREFKVFATMILITGLTVGHVLLSAMNAIWIAFFFVLCSGLHAQARKPCPAATR